MKIGLRIAAIAVLLLVAYAPVFKAGFIWDDDDYVTANAAVQSPKGLAEIWTQPGSTVQYYPLLFSALWLQHKLWGNNPLGYHLVNLTFHSANAVLLGVLLVSLEMPGAWLAAALFALHPVHVESVAWVAEEKNTLSTLFFLLSLLFYSRLTRGFRTHQLPLDGPQSKYYWLSFGLYLLALLSKTATVGLPVMIGLLLWWRKARLTKDDVLLLLPFFLMGAGLSIITILTESHIVGTTYVAWDLSGAERILLAGRVIWFYIAKLFWPHPLMFNYPKWTVHGSFGWYGYLLLTGFVFIVLYALRKKFGRGPVVAFLGFLTGLFPIMGFVNAYPFVYSYVADHFQYLASLSLISLGAIVISNLVNRMTSPLQQTLAKLGVAAILILFTFRTHQHAAHFENLETLWRSTIRYNPESILANHNLGVELLLQRRFQESIPYFQTVLRKESRHLGSLTGLGAAYVKSGQIDRGAEILRQALEVEPLSPEAHVFLSEVFVAKGDLTQARTHLERALSHKPFLVLNEDVKILRERIQKN